MYLRPAFTETDDARIKDLIRSNPFGLLLTHGPRGLEASHVPFLLEEDGEGFVVSGHLAAANPQCDAIGGDALVVFGGPHAYVAPGWYASQPAVPTWDYAAVHLPGVLEPITDVDKVVAGLQGLAAHDPMGFRVDALPKPYLAKMLAGIRAFRLRPMRVETQWKMSQNRSVADRLGVIAGLREQADHAAADTATLIEATLPPQAP